MITNPENPIADMIQELRGMANQQKQDEIVIIRNY
jgi:hypothetical protein